MLNIFVIKKLLSLQLNIEIIGYTDKETNVKGSSMNTETQKVVHKLNKKQVIILAAVVFALIQFLFSIRLLAQTLNYDRIYKGIYINDIYVSGMTPKEAEEILRENYLPRDEDMGITLKANGATQDIRVKNIINSLEVEQAVQLAYDQGREGSTIYRLWSIANTSLREKTIGLEHDFDEGKLQQLIGKFAIKVRKELVQSSYQIVEDKVVINFGRAGESIDEAALRKSLIDRINSFEPGALEIPTQITKPEPIDVDQIYSRVYTTAKDASYEVKDYKLTIIPHVIGRNFDLGKAEALVNENQDKGGSIEIPLELTYPSIYEQEIKDSIFKDTISSFSTKYNVNQVDRSENVKLSTSKINGIILGPGDVFSYNDVVGERTLEEGYREAPVYVSGRVVDGVGGGLCQVSTTLYNAVLFADLEVVERRNHNMIVSYVPPGRDATVSYGSIDFKFKNTFKNPIKVETSSRGGVLKISILGTQENPGKKIELETETLDTYSLDEKVIEDPTQPVGYYKVVQNGMKGYKVNTYKIIKQNGKTISKTKISTNRYNPLQRIVKKGTKKEETQ